MQWYFNAIFFEYKEAKNQDARMLKQEPRNQDAKIQRRNAKKIQRRKNQKNPK